MYLKLSKLAQICMRPCRVAYHSDRIHELDSIIPAEVYEKIWTEKKNYNRRNVIASSNFYDFL